LFSADDYPSDALRNGDEGRVRAKLTIGTDGRVTNCSIIESSGTNSLDRTTCSILTRKARFTPATDSNGNPTTDTYTTPPIVWKVVEQ
jgi:protein TonB